MFYSADEERNAEHRAEILFGATVDRIRADAVRRYQECERRAAIRRLECIRDFGEDFTHTPPKCVERPEEVVVWALRELDPANDRYAVGCAAEIAVFYGADSPASAIYGVRTDGTYTLFAD